jgi:hypothetical protein
MTEPNAESAAQSTILDPLLKLRRCTRPCQDNDHVLKKNSMAADPALGSP